MFVSGFESDTTILQRLVPCYTCAVVFENLKFHKDRTTRSELPINILRLGVTAEKKHSSSVQGIAGSSSTACLFLVNALAFQRAKISQTASWACICASSWAPGLLRLPSHKNSIECEGCLRSMQILSV